MTGTGVRSESPITFQVIARPYGGRCNLACSYCPYPSSKQGSSRMSRILLDSFTRQYIEAQQVPEVTFNWQGIEPLLMEPEFFQQVVNLQHKYRRPEMTVFNIVQTNGLLLDDDWCQFFQANGFLLIIGIDGPGDRHDSVRVDNDSQPTLKRVINKVELMHKHGVEFNTLTRIHAWNVDYPLEVYRFLRDQVKTHFMQFIPVVKHKANGITKNSVTGQQYGDFLKTIFNEWVRLDVETVSIDIIKTALLTWSGQQPDLCIFQKTCGRDLIIKHNGDIYACDRSVESCHRLGNIRKQVLTEIANSEQQIRFGFTKRDSLPTSCSQCQVQFVCNGGCPKDRVLATTEKGSEQNYLCEGYLDFFNYIGPSMKFITDELAAERSPGNIMYHIAQQEAMLQIMLSQAEPDHPCPCGSGLLFKNCHGRGEA